MRLSGQSLFSFVVLVLLGPAVSAQTITEFPLPEGAEPRKIVAAAEGYLWFLDSRSATIGRITTTGDIARLSIEGPFQGVPWDIASGPDGNLWITEMDDGQSAIVRISPSGALTRWLVDIPNTPVDITAGLDGNLWISLASGRNGEGAAIGRSTTAGEITVFQVDGWESVPFGSIPAGIAAGPDGNVWFTGLAVNRIGRITPAGAITEFILPTPPCAPRRITTGPDGNLWFTESDTNRIGRITPGGIVTEFPVPTAGVEIAAGPDGALWFTQSSARLGRITPSGAVTEIPIPAPAFHLTAGPDGNIWFTESSVGKIGRLTLAPLQVSDLRVLPVVGSTPGVGGTLFRTAVQLHNATDGPMTGRIVFHPSGVSDDGSNAGRFHYSLQPGQTQSIADLLPAIGRSGLGSADIEVTAGLVPTATVRVFNDAGPAGTMGFTEEPMSAEAALEPGRPGVLLLPADPTNFRFNLGVRTLWDGATATLTLRDAGGALVTTASRAFPATFHKQWGIRELFELTSLPPAGGSISIAVDSGAAFFYGATVDNTTGDPSFQIASAQR
jgi:streptogramin lyase